MNNCKLVLENGVVFEGKSFGCKKEAVATIVYNTSVVGYQEIISDPTNCNQILCMTYPLIGNYGLTDEDYESKKISIKGMIVREYNEEPSNFRYTTTLSEKMEENDIVGICGVDTRCITRIIRKEGNIKGLICDIDKPLEECIEIIKNYQDEENLVEQVTSKNVWYSRTPNQICSIAVLDLGGKLNFIKRLNAIGCNVIIFPYNVTKEKILKYKPDGLFITSGPGNPKKLADVIELVKSFIGEMPIFGVGLGCNILGLCYGAEIYKMKNGHHGANYPVRNLDTKKVEISNQNHFYTFDKEKFNNNCLNNAKLKITHENVLTHEIEGVIDEDNKVIGLEFDPVSPIDEDSENIFLKFLQFIKQSGGK